jgi:hypothetical protein
MCKITKDLQYKKICKIDKEMLGIVTILNQALFNGDMLAAKGTHAASTALLQSN